MRTCHALCFFGECLLVSEISAGLAWGLLLGLVGGLLAGVTEAVRILQSATGRAGAQEAALYALIVDALGFGAIIGLVGGLVGAILQLLRVRLSLPTLAALYVSGALALSFFLARVIAMFPARGVGTGTGSALDVAMSFATALGAGIVVFPLMRPIAWRVLASVRRVALVGLAASLMLAFVLPAQILLEMRSQLTLSRGTARTVSLDILERDLSASLEARLEEALAGGTGSVAEPPNVLFITVDALRADHLGACGNDWIQTPWMDLLARYGTLSCSTYTQQPQSNPALASLFTSTYPAVHGVRMHMVDRLPDHFDTLAEVLSSRGYGTGAILPWTALEPAFSGFHQGFQVYEAFVVNAPPALNNPITASLGAMYRRVTDQVAIGGAIEAVIGMREQVEEDIDGRADVTAAAAINWLTTNRKTPFFLWVHFFDPHYPWTPPEPWDHLYEDGSYDGPYDGSMGFVFEMREGIFEPNEQDVAYLRNLYASEVSYADHHVGKVLGYAAEMGLLRNTIVVLTADHGESLGERGGPWPEGDFWLHGDDLYSPGVRVPLIVFDPRRTQTGHQLAVPVQHIDVMPTILEMVGAPVPSMAQGRSLLPVMDGIDAGPARFAITTLTDDRATAIISSDGWKLITYRPTGKQELYHLPTDPRERVDLSSSLPARVAELTAMLDERSRSMSAQAVANWPQPDPGGG